MIGGGTPVAQTDYSQGWLVTYSSGTIVNLTPRISTTAAEFVSNSSILSVTAASNSWVIGGYLKNRGLLYEYSGGSFTNLSDLVSSFTYVNWVGGVAVQYHMQSFVPVHYHYELSEPRMIRGQYKGWVADTLPSFEEH